MPIAFTYSVYSLGRSRSEIIDDASDESLRDTHTHIYLYIHTCIYINIYRYMQVSRNIYCTIAQIGGGFKYFYFSSLHREKIQFDLRIFFKWVGSTTN